MGEDKVSQVDLGLLAERLSALVGRVVDDLGRQTDTGLAVDAFVAEISGQCAELESEIEATTVAKAGLEAMLTTYLGRYGDRADKMPDVIRFRSIMAEKVRRLDQLREEMAQRAARIEQVLADLAATANQANDSLAELEQALFAVKATRQALLEKVLADKDKIKQVAERFWPVAVGGEGPRINLTDDALGAAVDRAVAAVAPEQTEMSDLLRQVLGSIKDVDLRRVIADKVGPTELDG